MAEACAGDWRLGGRECGAGGRASRGSATCGRSCDQQRQAAAAEPCENHAGQLCVRSRPCRLGAGLEGFNPRLPGRGRARPWPVPQPSCPRLSPPAPRWGRQGPASSRLPFFLKHTHAAEKRPSAPVGPLPAPTGPCRLCRPLSPVAPAGPQPGPAGPCRLWPAAPHLWRAPGAPGPGRSPPQRCWAPASGRARRRRGCRPGRSRTGGPERWEVRSGNGADGRVGGVEVWGSEFRALRSSWVSTKQAEAEAGPSQANRGGRPPPTHPHTPKAHPGRAKGHHRRLGARVGLLQRVGGQLAQRAAQAVPCAWGEGGVRREAAAGGGLGSGQQPCSVRCARPRRHGRFKTRRTPPF